MKKNIPRHYIAFLLILTFPMFMGFLDTKRSLAEKGNKSFQEKRYRQALENYEKAAKRDLKNPAIHYNIGNALYKLAQHKEANLEYERVLKTLPKDSDLAAQSLYNYGNAQYRLGNFDQAIAAYKKVLDINPKDQDAKYNLEFLLQKKNEYEKKQDERRTPQEKQENQKNEQDENQQSQKNQQSNENQQGGQGSEQDQNAGGGSNQQDQSEQVGGQNQKDQSQGAEGSFGSNQSQQAGGEGEQQKSDAEREQEGQGQAKGELKKEDAQSAQEARGQEQSSSSQNGSEQKKSNLVDSLKQLLKEGLEGQKKDDERQADQEKGNQGEQKDESGQKQEDQQDQGEENPENQYPSSEDKEGEDGSRGESQAQNEPQEISGLEGGSLDGGGEAPSEGLPQSLGTSPAERGRFNRITKESALQILNALQEAEKELLYLRRPPETERRHEVAKDW